MQLNQWKYKYVFIQSRVYVYALCWLGGGAGGSRLFLMYWETRSLFSREEREFYNVSLRESNVPRNIFRHEALTELINMTHSLKRVILNDNSADKSTNYPKHEWKSCEMKMSAKHLRSTRFFSRQQHRAYQHLLTVHIIHFSFYTTVLNVHLHWTFSLHAKIRNRLLCGLDWSVILN
jgi:hypothetical protein